MKVAKVRRTSGVFVTRDNDDGRFSMGELVFTEASGGE